jgi:uncharacterized BrkB/YihY/UPF0761 family membrane protein
MELLKSFYRKANPVGLWWPVRRAIEAEQGVKINPPKMLLPAGLLITLIGAIWLISSVICVSVLFVGKWKYAILSGLVAIVFAIVFKYAFKWHIDRISRPCM